MTPNRDPQPSDKAKAIDASVAQMRQSIGRGPSSPPGGKRVERGPKVGYYATFAILAVGLMFGAYLIINYVTEASEPELPPARGSHADGSPDPSSPAPATLAQPSPQPAPPPKRVLTQSTVRPSSPAQPSAPVRRAPVVQQPPTPDPRPIHARVAYDYAHDHFMEKYSVGSTSRVREARITLGETIEVSGWDQYRTTGEVVLEIRWSGSGRTERVKKRFEVVTEARPGGYVRGERIIVRDSFNFRS